MQFTNYPEEKFESYELQDLMNFFCNLNFISNYTILKFFIAIVINKNIHKISLVFNLRDL